MELQISGKCIRVFDSKYVSKKDGMTKLKHHFVIETNEEYRRTICFSVLSDERWQNMRILVGGTYVVNFNVESREWQGKWFTEVVAWRVVPIEGATSNTQQQRYVQSAQGGTVVPY